MKVLCVDPGKNWACVLFVLGRSKISIQQEYDGPFDFYESVKSAANYADVIVHGTPVRHAKVIAYQSKQIGILELIAEQNGIGTIPVVDNSAKKIVLGKGNATKDDIMKKYNLDNEHLADCHMFYDYFMHFQK